MDNLRSRRFNIGSSCPKSAQVVIDHVGNLTDVTTAGKFKKNAREGIDLRSLGDSSKIINTIGGCNRLESSLLQVARGLINIVGGILCKSSTEYPNEA